MTFGSFESTFVPKGEAANVGVDNLGAAESSQDGGEPVKESSSRLVNSILAVCLFLFLAFFYFNYVVLSLLFGIF